MAGKTCVICGKPSGMYPLCREHLQMKADGKVVKCDSCGKWHEIDKQCECKQTHYYDLPRKGFNKCLLCNTQTAGYAFCSECYNKFTNDELLEILNAKDHLKIAKTIEEKYVVHEEKQPIEHENNNNNVASKKCLLCNNESGEFVFCKSCFAKYRNKTLLLKITVTKDQQLELLDESYEGLYICKDGHVVKSKSERDIDNYLFEHKIAHAYEKALIIDSEIFHPDFYLPELDIYLEHWGYDESNLEYTRRKEYKIPKYKAKGITLISTYEKDMKDVDTSLDIKLAKYKKGELNYLDE